ncbi:hypothetical protein CONCODRAFT_19792 [Conidiobolus coronatus NRRL 28638]|uniref:Uncharacterized protein n=1 Tax=Conidiobolus coronatus (strain ATCC 28846 / CBS 209.66 / NRRL 28638) TaxID=796925 RepID=A0A137NX09_CONC2|nr:hypothetical protein CONCODRAFT_19792 [Conidiobolus coronatus NRRL 28638]|eukprot:KXN67174.1 hypothetical protein CONCODRAFT_19792 [Conidiobolus coronatus NRRL 28638]
MNINEFNAICLDEIIGCLQLNDDNWCLENGYFLKLKGNTGEFVVFNIESFKDIRFIYIINYSQISYSLTEFNNSSDAGLTLTGLLTKKSKLIKLESFLVFSLTIKVYKFTKIILVKDWRLHDLKIGSRYKFQSCFLLFNNVFEFGGSKVENLDDADDIILEPNATELIVQHALDLELGLIKCENDCYLIIDNRLDLINYTFGPNTKILLFDSDSIELSTNQNKIRLFNIDLFTNYKITKLVLEEYKRPVYYIDSCYQSDIQWVYRTWLLKAKLIEINLTWAFLAIMNFCNIQYFKSKSKFDIEDLIPNNSKKVSGNINLDLNYDSVVSSSNQFILLKLVLNDGFNGLDWIDSSTRVSAKVKFKGISIESNLKLWIDFWYIVPRHLLNNPVIELKYCLKLDLNDTLLTKSFGTEEHTVDYSCKTGFDNSSETSTTSHLNTPGAVTNLCRDFNHASIEKRSRTNSSTISFQILNQYSTAHANVIQCISTTKLNMFYLVLNKYRFTEFDLARFQHFQIKDYEVISSNYLTMNSCSSLEITSPKLVPFDTITGRIVNLSWRTHNTITYEMSKIFITSFNLTVESLDQSIIELNCNYLLLQKVIKFEDLKQLSMNKAKLKDLYYEFTVVKLNIASFKPLKSIAICYKLLDLIENN